MDLTEITKTVKLDLMDLNGNAFALMGGFQRQARREGWEGEEIECVLEECRNGDYDHLVQTLMQYCDA